MTEERRMGRAGQGARAGLGAQADAEHLRGRYGPAAEAWCQDALASLPAGDPRRAWVMQIARALRATPAPQAANARICVQQQGVSPLSIAEP